MDSHQPADPWEIPAVPVDEAEPVEAPDTGSVLVEDDVSAEPRNPAPTAAERAAEPPAPPSPAPEPPEDEVVMPDVVVDEVVVDEAAVPEAAVDEVLGADPVVEAVDVFEGETDPVDEVAVVAETTPEPAAPRFDLGLDEEPAEPWGGEGPAFESGTAFDLVRPDPADDPEPEYEVSEPDLSETFVSSAGSGRPDLSTPQLTDPAPMFAVPDDQLDDLADTPPPADEGTAESGDQPSGFRLPGLSVFGRRKATEPVDEPESEEPAAEVGEAVTVEAADVPPIPSAWSDTPPVGAADPGSPFVEAPGEPVTEPDEPPLVEADPFEVSEPPLVEADPFEVSEAESVETDPVEAPVAEPVEADPFEAPEAEPVETDPVEAPVAEAPEPEPVVTMPPTRGPVFDEDHPAIELTEPDLTEVLDAPELYVTETASMEDRPPALLTVDSVPGATIAQAVDVVTAVASAANEKEIAEALDRTMTQLRDRAAGIGGEAVISVHTEVQEIGGGFLVIASGTAVTLA